MEWLWALFVIGSFWFWAAIAVESILLILFIEEWEMGGRATFSVLVTLAAFQFLGNLDVFQYLANNALNFIGYLAAYFVLGTIWAVVKWWTYVTIQREKYDAAKEKFFTRHRPETHDSHEVKSSWKVIVEHSRSARTESCGTEEFEYKPQARRHKGKILRWMTYWPWSLLWTLLRDFVKRIFTAIYNKIQKFLQFISDRAFRGTEKDF